MEDMDIEIKEKLNEKEYLEKKDYQILNVLRRRIQ